jgi:hypothetical protein
MSFIIKLNIDNKVKKMNRAMSIDLQQQLLRMKMDLLMELMPLVNKQMDKLEEIENKVMCINLDHKNVFEIDFHINQ